jgi:hypothetical protein
VVDETSLRLEAEAARKMNRRYSSVQELDGGGWEEGNFGYRQHYRLDSALSSSGSEKWAVELDGSGIR